MVGLEMRLYCQVKPNAHTARIVSYKPLIVAIAAPAKENAANEGLSLFLAGLLDIPKTSVIILKGLRGRHKVVEIPDGTDIKKLHI